MFEEPFRDPPPLCSCGGYEVGGMKGLGPVGCVPLGVYSQVATLASRYYMGRGDAGWVTVAKVGRG